MKFMAANDRPRRPDRAFYAKACLTVSEMQLAISEARAMSQETGHPVARAARVLYSLAQHHVAAALAMDRPRLREAREPRLKFLRSSELTTMELRIAARQPADVAALGRRLIGERRKRHDFRARFAPRREQMGIDEGERRVGRERNAM